MILSHPFRLSLNGSAATVEDGTEAAAAEAVAVLALTLRGERPMCPAFGVSDPAFAGYDAGELAAGLALFGPDGVVIDGVAAAPVNDTTARVTITFNLEDPDATS